VVARDQRYKLKYLIFERYAGRAAFKAHIETKAFLEPSIFVPMEPISG
jgi:quinol monooxygenase YgiN